MKLQQLKSGQFFVSLPCKIVKAKGWQKGDTLIVEIDSKGNLIIKK